MAAKMAAIVNDVPPTATQPMVYTSSSKVLKVKSFRNIVTQQKPNGREGEGEGVHQLPPPCTMVVGPRPQVRLSYFPAQIVRYDTERKMTYSACHERGT